MACCSRQAFSNWYFEISVHFSLEERQECISKRGIRGPEVAVPLLALNLHIPLYKKKHSA